MNYIITTRTEMQLFNTLFEVFKILYKEKSIDENRNDAYYITFRIMSQSNDNSIVIFLNNGKWSWMESFAYDGSKWGTHISVRAFISRFRYVSSITKKDILNSHMDISNMYKVYRPNVITVENSKVKYVASIDDGIILTNILDIRKFKKDLLKYRKSLMVK